MICVDEMGPVSAKTYPGAEWKPEDGRRATYDADYGRRGKVWVFGAFDPVTGRALTVCHPRRDSEGFLRLLDRVFEVFPAERYAFIWDNLSVHLSKRTQLALLSYAEKHRIRVLLLPKYAAWLNLIEPWWKQLRGLALNGKRFESVDEVVRAVDQATEYWNRHAHPYVWRKKETRKPTLK